MAIRYDTIYFHTRRYATIRCDLASWPHATLRYDKFYVMVRRYDTIRYKNKKCKAIRYATMWFRTKSGDTIRYDERLKNHHAIRYATIECQVCSQTLRYDTLKNATMHDKCRYEFISLLPCICWCYAGFVFNATLMFFVLHYCVFVQS